MLHYEFHLYLSFISDISEFYHAYLHNVNIVMHCRVPEGKKNGFGIFIPKPACLNDTARKTSAVSAVFPEIG